MKVRTHDFQTMRGSSRAEVCASFDTFVCMDRDVCYSLLDTAASYDLFPVPRNEAELRAAWWSCGRLLRCAGEPRGSHGSQ